MLCPFCLAHVRFRRERQGSQGAIVYRCPTCREPVPAMYVQDYRRYPPVVLSAVGFRGHGKTVYFAALFYTLKKLSPAHYWPEFSSMGLDEASLETVYGSVTMLNGGALPDSTPKSFPRPTMLRLAGVPRQRDCPLLCYDTAGECFERPTQLVQFAGFVRRAQTALLLISIPDLVDDNAAQQMHLLLNTYVVGMRQLGGRAQAQHLIVVFTKADEVAALFTPPWDDLRRHLSTGAIRSLTPSGDALTDMESISARLEEFVRQEVQALDFLHLAQQHFGSVTFSLVSALGSQPQGQHPSGNCAAPGARSAAVDHAQSVSNAAATLAGVVAAAHAAVGPSGCGALGRDTGMSIPQEPIHTTVANVRGAWRDVLWRAWRFCEDFMMDAIHERHEIRTRVTVNGEVLA